MLLTLLITWAAIINITGFSICAADKRKARKGRWRIPEKTIFIIAIIGGSIGTYAALLLFRHKTKHFSFMFGVPFIFVIQVMAVVWLIR